MISKEHKSKIVSYIGFRYVAEIQAYLKQKKIFNRKGEMYSRSVITNVMNGQIHSVLVPVIYDLAAIKKEELRKETELRRSKISLSALDKPTAEL